MKKIKLKLLHNIIIVIICIGVISVFSFAYLHRQNSAVVYNRENSSLISQQFLFGKNFKSIRYNQKTPRNLFASLIYYRILIWCGYYGLTDKAINCISQNTYSGQEIPYGLYIEKFRKLTSSFIGLNFTLADIPESSTKNSCIVELGAKNRTQKFYLSKKQNGDWYFTEENFNDPSPEEIKIYHAFSKATEKFDNLNAKYSLPLTSYFVFIMGFHNQMDFTFADAQKVMDLKWVNPLIKNKYSHFMAFQLYKILQTKNINTTSVSWFETQNQDIVLLYSANSLGNSIYLQKKIFETQKDPIWIFNRKVLNNAHRIFLYENMQHNYADPLSFTIQHFLFNKAQFLRFNIFGYTAYFWLIVLIGLIIASVVYKYCKNLIFFLLTKFHPKEIIGKYKKRAKRFSIYSSLIVSFYIYIKFIEYDMMFYYTTYLYFTYFTTIVLGILIMCWLCIVTLISCSVIAYLLELKSEEKFRITFAIEIIQRLLCIVIVIVFSGILLQKLGIDTIHYLTALGIGGLAVALAGKDTIENLFGSIMIALEKPFKIGDWIIIGDIDGFVEYVGLRSTRIRTFEDSYLTVPNVKFTTSSVNNMGKRTYRRYKTILDFKDTASPELLKKFINRVEEIIKSEHNIRKDKYFVKLNDIGESSVKILVWVYFTVPDLKNEKNEREKFIFAILNIIKELGLELAYPSQTLYLTKHLSEKNNNK